MEIRFLGTGGAFDYAYGNSAAWLTLGGRRLLIDCGNTVYGCLRQAHLADLIDHLMITHCHDDHVGSLCSTILHHKYFLQPSRKAHLLVPSWSFRDELYEFLRHGLIHPERYVSFSLIEELPGVRAIDTYGLHVTGMQSYGFVFEDEQEVVMYSGDLGDPEIIFHHAKPYLGQKPIRIFHELCFDRTDGIHTYYQDLIPKLATYPIWGYHADPSQNPVDNSIPLVAHQPSLLIS
jgi:glyoxylase-like metal-dependent hydrolase (beta-lactamase superfamily II)